MMGDAAPRRCASGIAGFLCLLLAASSAPAQQSAPANASAEQSQSGPSQLPSFDVVSIKPHKDEGMMVRAGMRTMADGISLSGVPLQILMRQAFGVSDDRILNEPEWVRSARYDIEAKIAPEDAAKMKGLTSQQRFAMMLPVFEDRFALKFHRETRALEVYTLVVTRGGSKLTLAKPDEAATTGSSGPPRAGSGAEGTAPMWMGPGNSGTAASKPEASSGAAKSSMMMSTSTQGIKMEGVNVTMTMLAQTISQQLGSTVIDRTELSGSYDFKLSFMPDMTTGATMAAPGGAPPPDGAQTMEPTGPSIFAALQEQLGLKLMPQKETVDVIVIDDVEQPSPN